MLRMKHKWHNIGTMPFITIFATISLVCIKI